MAIFKNFFSFFLVFLHLACFNFTSTRKKTKTTSSPLSLHSASNSHSRLKLIKSHKAFLFLKHIFSSHSSKPVSQAGRTHPNPSIASPCSSTRSLRHSTIFSVIPNHAFADDPDYPTRKPTGSIPDSEFSSDTIRNDIHPCQICGEIFQRSSVLEQHQSTRHAVSELVDGDSGKNIVSIIFNTGWTSRVKEPSIYRILKIHSGSKILNRFEEYRECVKSKASRHGSNERCIADGNELLRFHCTTFLCDLGQNGNSGICSQQYCSVCGIIKSGFSSKLDGIATLSTSWRAHVAIPEDIEVEFSFLNLKRAMLVCRVIAGRVGCDPALADKEDSGYDSLRGRGPGPGRVEEEDELLVYNPRAVLPCFVIVYTV